MTSKGKIVWNRRQFLKVGALAPTATLAACTLGEQQMDNQNPSGQGTTPTPVVTTPTTATPPTAFGRLSGQVAFVTGSARGIGRATAVKLALEGADIVSLDIAAPIGAAPPATPADLEETERLIRETGRRVISIQADVRDLPAMQEAVQRAVSEFERVDMMIANAGAVVWENFQNSSLENWSLVVDVNINGVFNSIKAVIPHMIERRYGRIVTLASIGGRQGVVGNGSYTTTKWAVIGLTKSAALELGQYNITVNAISPTAVNTPMYRSEGQMASTGAADHAAQDEQMLAHHALPVGPVEPEVIADGIAFLCSDEARFISGVALDIAAGGNARYTA